MKQLSIPAYDPVLVASLSAYVAATTAKNPWVSSKDGVADFKREVTRLLLIEQNKRCAYCGARFFSKEPARDHIAPKETYRKWMFWPENIVLACHDCNSGAKKTYDPIAVLNPVYGLSEFKFVHPYFDDPKLHIRFVGHRGNILISARGSSKKGQETIDLFDLANSDRSIQRAKDALWDSDVEHLHGKWCLLFQQVTLAVFSKDFVLKMR